MSAPRDEELEALRVEPQPALPGPNPYRAERESLIACVPFEQPDPVCEQCGLGVDQAEWIYIRTPDWTWEELCGREGWAGRCPKDGSEITFVLTLMN